MKINLISTPCFIKKFVKFFFFIFALIFVDSYALLPSQQTHVLINWSIDADLFFHKFSQATAQYFQISLIRQKNHPNLLNVNENFVVQHTIGDQCSSLPYLLKDQPVYFCSQNQQHSKALYHQLVSSIDCPITREFCYRSENCQLPEVFHESFFRQSHEQFQ